MNRVLFIADNQEHLLLGKPLRSMSWLTENTVTSVAIRSPLANVGGLNLFRSELEFGESQNASMTVHLGDASDISCPDELTRTFDTLDASAPGQWFMAMGNHDGLLAGTYSEHQPEYDFKNNSSIHTTPPSEALSSVTRAWVNACISPENHSNTNRANILTKGDAISMYNDRIKSRTGATVTKMPDEVLAFRNTTTEITCSVEKIILPNENYESISRICPRTQVHGKSTWIGPYASYIVQKIDIGETRLVLIDTSYYESPTVKNVGLKGSLSQAQRDRHQFLFGEQERTSVIVAGHHPFKDLPNEDQEWLARYSTRYISGHAHTSAVLISHNYAGLELSELNIGSALDYPPQVVLMDIGQHNKSFCVAGANTEETNWPGFLDACEKNRADWYLDKKIYTEYLQGNYVTNILRSLDVAAEAAPRELSTDIPDGTKISDWMALNSILNEIHDSSDAYWACQAYYASEATSNERGWFEKLASVLSYRNPKGASAVGSWLRF
ncbi:MAG: metallophosphoesterase [Pseudomonadota bacterium]